METKTLIRLAMTLLSALMLGCSCSREKADEPDAEMDDGMVDLVLNLSVNAGGSNAFTATTRAYDSPTRAEDIAFEYPTNQWEGVRTLRVIIIRPGSNNLVEHNELKRYTENDLWQTLDEEKFKVVGDEWKRIYLVANEATLPESMQAQLEGIAAGEPLSVAMGDLTLTTSAAPYIDNSGWEKAYVPMSEFFDIHVRKGIPGATVDEQHESLFITRSAVKFSFTATDIDNSHSKGLKITSLRISGIGDKEWLFPHNAIYSPEKYQESHEDKNGRAILSFRLPDNSGTFDYTFTPDNFGLPGIAVASTVGPTFVPMQYFLESGLPQYTLTVTTELEGLIRVYPTVTLPNLPLLPRNTHVKVNIGFKQEEIFLQVDLLPYIGVTLDPIFGNNDIVKPPKPRETVQ